MEALARQHGEAAASAPAGRSSETFYGGHERVLRQTLIALSAGHSMVNHLSPAEATLLVIRGRVRMTAGEHSWEGRYSDVLIIPETEHEIEAVDDAVVVLTVAMPPAQ